MTLLYPADLAGDFFQKLTLPTDGPDSGPWADEIVPPQLAAFTNSYCKIAKDQSLVMRTYHGGATTSGSKNPRTEWRETNRRGALKFWDGRRNHHQMLLPELMVTRLTPVKPQVVLGQIHNGDDDVTVLRAEGIKDAQGRLTNMMTMWLTDGDNSHAHRLGLMPLLQKFSFGFDVFDGRVHYLWNGQPVQNFTVSATDDCYFKWGLYLQSNWETAPTEKITEYAAVKAFKSPFVDHRTRR